jgi:hypothetical protein
MYAISNERARRARLAIVLAAGFFFLPVTAGHLGQIGYASAWAGDQGGGHDQVRGTQSYTGYSASAPLPETPCQSCLTGAMGSGYVAPVQQTPQGYTNYSVSDSPPPTPAPCQSCLNGAVGTGFTPPFSR